MMSSWYSGASFILHYDQAWSPEGVPHPAEALDPEQLRRLLAQVRPDAVQYPAKTAAGYVPYATRHGNALPGLEARPELDLLGTYRDVTRELGIRFVAVYSGLIDHQAAAWRREWLRVDARREPYSSRALCPNAGYVEELMLPQLEEIVERYQVDGFWLDAGAWTVSPCYCPACESEYQMLHNRSAPLEMRDPFWPEWLQFHRMSFQRYLARVGRFLHERRPGAVLASAGAFCAHQPEPPPEGLDRLSADLSPAFSLRQAGLEGRHLASRGLPFDLLTWSRCSARPWARGRLPAIPAYPKTFEHLAQEGAVIMAGGGRWGVWVSADAAGSLSEREHAIVGRAAEHARARWEWCRDTASAAPAAVLHSASTHSLAGNGLYDHGGCLDRIRGAHQMLQELHVPHDLIGEERLAAELDAYRLLVLPEQIALPAELDALIVAWVRRGGRLLASGRVSPRPIEEIPTFALEEALGVRWTGGREPEGYLLHRDQPLWLATPVYQVELHGAECLRPLCRSGNAQDPRPAPFPAVTRHRLGAGETCYVAADLFTYYHRVQYPGLRVLVGDLLNALFPDPVFRTTAPATVEVVLRQRGRELLVHLLNLAPGRSLAQNSPFIEAVPPAGPLTVSLALATRPRDVRLQPDGAVPEWSYAAGRLTVAVPEVHIWRVVEASGE